MTSWQRSLRRRRTAAREGGRHRSGVCHGVREAVGGARNLGHFAERDKYGALSLKHADRLTLRERYYIEGFYYGNRRETAGQSIEAYKKCLEVDPAHQACRNNLALRYGTLERFNESIEEYEELLRRGSTPTTTTGVWPIIIGRSAPLTRLPPKSMRL